MQPLHELNQYMQPGYEGYLDHPVPTVAELLRDAGYRTPFAGQWHVALFPPWEKPSCCTWRTDRRPQPA